MSPSTIFAHTIEWGPALVEAGPDCQTWRQSSTISRAEKCDVMKLFVADFFVKKHTLTE